MAELPAVSTYRGRSKRPAPGEARPCGQEADQVTMAGTAEIRSRPAGCSLGAVQPFARPDPSSSLGQNHRFRHLPRLPPLRMRWKHPKKRAPCPSLSPCKSTQQPGIGLGRWDSPHNINQEGQGTRGIRTDTCRLHLRINPSSNPASTIHAIKRKCPTKALLPHKAQIFCQTIELGAG